DHCPGNGMVHVEAETPGTAKRKRRLTLVQIRTIYVTQSHFVQTPSDVSASFPGPVRANLRGACAHRGKAWGARDANFFSNCGRVGLEQRRSAQAPRQSLTLHILRVEKRRARPDPARYLGARVLYPRHLQGTANPAA